MVVGIGTDLTEIDRVRRTIERFGERFLQRVFTAGEIAYCMRKRAIAESFAARFAAKEAGAKAVGTGISRGVGWLEFEVVRELSGQPALLLHGRAAEIARGMRVARVSLSLTHAREMAMAVVVMEDSDK